MRYRYATIIALVRRMIATVLTLTVRRAALDTAGFAAYGDATLAQISSLMAVAPGGVDFQLDVFPDGGIGAKEESPSSLSVRSDRQNAM